MKKKSKILVTRFSAMGDVAMTTIVVKAVVEQNDGVEIIFASRDFFSPFFKHIPNTKFVGVDLKNKYKGVSGLYRLFKKLKKEKPHYIADLHDVLRTKILRTFFQISGYKVSVIDKGRKEKRALTAKNNKILKPLKSTFERYADVFRDLGFQVDLNRVKVFEKPKLSKQAKLFLQTFENSKLIGIAPFAAHEGKQYPLKYIKEIILEILEKDDKISIILFGGGKKEKELLDEMEKINRNRVVNLTSMFSLEEELQIISRLDKILSMDSGNAHMAAMFGVPVISIWGATHPFAGFTAFNQPVENQILPDLKKFPQIPTSIYGNKIFDNFKEVWETISKDEIIDKLM